MRRKVELFTEIPIAPRSRPPNEKKVVESFVGYEFHSSRTVDDFVRLTLHTTVVFTRSPAFKCPVTVRNDDEFAI